PVAILAHSGHEAEEADALADHQSQRVGSERQVGYLQRIPLVRLGQHRECGEAAVEVRDRNTRPCETLLDYSDADPAAESETASVNVQREVVGLHVRDIEGAPKQVYRTDSREAEGNAAEYSDLGVDRGTRRPLASGRDGGLNRSADPDG